MKEYGAAIGRYCPIQLGHQVVLRRMLDICRHTVVFVGSCNAPWSLPLFFSYTERTAFIRKLFPSLNIIALPDFPGDNAAWLQAVRDALDSCGMDPAQVTFFGGSDEDVLVLSGEGGYETEIVNRYDGTTPVISASQVRDALIHDRPLDGMIDPIIADDVRRLWNHKWPDFMKKR